MVNLPVKVRDMISARSLKFYDGTYVWNGNGFKDENGVYREFDSLDPEASPPTPLPPLDRSDEEGENEDEQTTFNSKSNWLVRAVRTRTEYKAGELAPSHSPHRSEAENDDMHNNEELSLSLPEEAALGGHSLMPAEHDKAAMFSSPLTDCPTDLSDWDVIDWVKSPSPHPAKTSKRRKQSDDSDEDYVPENERKKKAPKKKRQNHPKQSPRRLTKTR